MQKNVKVLVNAAKCLECGDSILNDLPRRVWVDGKDKTALTLAEIMEETGEGRNWCQRYVEGLMKGNKHEVVWKRVNGKPVRAYRRKK